MGDTRRRLIGFLAVMAWWCDVIWLATFLTCVFLQDSFVYNAGGTDLKPPWMEKKTTDRKAYSMAREMKETYKALDDEKKDQVRFYGDQIIKQRGENSQGYQRLREISTWMGGIPSGTKFLDMCCGAGGSTQWAMECGANVTCFTRKPKYYKGKMIKAEEPLFDTRSVNFRYAELSEVVPRSGYDWILMEAGEEDYDMVKEAAQAMRLLTRVKKWLELNPAAHFLISIRGVYDRQVQMILSEMQQITGRGAVDRYHRDRLSQGRVYFHSARLGDIQKDANEIYAAMLMEMLVAQSTPLREEGLGRHEPWQQEVDFGAPPLDPLDMTDSIASLGTLREPLGLTKFLKEIGWWPTERRGVEGGKPNGLVNNLLTRGINLADELSRQTTFGYWSPTSTAPAAVNSMVSQKLDREPLENHRHLRRLRLCYKAFTAYLKSKGAKLRMLNHEEVKMKINRNGAMGRNKKARNLGEYVDGNDWIPDVEEDLRDMLKGKPKHGIMNSTPKREKKKNFTRQAGIGSRLIQFLDGDMRIAEAMVFGELGGVTALNPWSVSGYPIYDYGDLMVERMGHRVAVAQDVAGWDTRVSKALQRMECEALMEMADDERHRQLIKAFYRLYANGYVTMQRSYKGSTHEVLYAMRGQVASGRYPTYDMNTSTNTVVILAALSHSLGIHEHQVGAWVRETLEGDDVRAMVSGDDMVLFLEVDAARLFADRSGGFMHEIGMPRKDMREDESLKIMSSIDDIEFCSHRYYRASFRSQMGEHIKVMPYREIGEVMAKVKWVTGLAKNEPTEHAWARLQGLNLMVMYHSLPEARDMAKALLTATPEGLNLKGLVSGWDMMNKPWLTREFGLEMINDCFFGASTRFPTNFRLDSLGGLPYLPGRLRLRSTISRNNRVVTAWRSQLEEQSLSLRLMLPGAEFTNWFRREE